MSALWTIAANPRRRRKAGGRKHRSAAQRAATARMLAANRSRRGGHAKRRARRASGASRSRTRTVVVHANPRRTVKRRSARRSTARRSMAGFGNSFMGYLKTGAAGAGGALVVDAGYGFLASMLPVSMQTKQDAAGGVNYMYYAGKGALAAAVGAFGGKVMPPRIAHAMAAGSFVVMMYEIIRPMVASALPTVNLGWFNPAPTAALGAYGAGSTRLGAYADSGSKVAHIKSPMAVHG
jgi:hypothetical protein